METYNITISITSIKKTSGVRVTASIGESLPTYRRRNRHTNWNIKQEVETALKQALNIAECANKEPKCSTMNPKVLDGQLSK